MGLPFQDNSRKKWCMSSIYRLKAFLSVTILLSHFRPYSIFLLNLKLPSITTKALMMLISLLLILSLSSLPASFLPYFPLSRSSQNLLPSDSSLLSPITLFAKFNKVSNYCTFTLTYLLKVSWHLISFIKASYLSCPNPNQTTPLILAFYLILINFVSFIQHCFWSGTMWLSLFGALKKILCVRKQDKQ